MEKTELMQVVKLLDKIIVSNNVAIKDAFRELLIITALTEVTNDETPGPLANLICTELAVLREEIRRMRQELSYARSSGNQPHDYRSGSIGIGRGYADPWYTSPSSATDHISSIDWAAIMKKPSSVIKKEG